MKREAVQEERQRNKPDNEVESSTNTNNMIQQHLINSQQMFQDLTIEKLLEAEKKIEYNHSKVCCQFTSNSFVLI